MYHWLLVAISVCQTHSTYRNVTSDISEIIKLICLHGCNLQCCIKKAWKHLKPALRAADSCCLSAWGSEAFCACKWRAWKWWLHILSCTNGRNTFEFILIKIWKVSFTEINSGLLAVTPCVFLAVQMFLLEWSNMTEGKPDLIWRQDEEKRYLKSLIPSSLTGCANWVSQFHWESGLDAGAVNIFNCSAHLPVYHSRNPSQDLQCCVPVWDIIQNPSNNRNTYFKSQ